LSKFLTAVNIAEAEQIEIQFVGAQQTVVRNEADKACARTRSPQQNVEQTSANNNDNVDNVLP